MDTDCSQIDARSTCVDGLPKPDEAAREEIKALKESCMPRRQRSDDDDDDDEEPPRRRGPRRGGQGQRGGDDDQDDDDQSPPEPFLAGRKMCSIPPAYFVVSILYLYQQFFYL